MKLLHLADLHLGKRVNGFDLLEDQRAVLAQVLALCEEHGVQAVALAGDIYDTPVPPAGAVLLLDWFLSELCARGVAVLAVSGNHDSAERLDYAAGLLARQGVHIAGRFTGRVPVAVLADAAGPVEFCLLPFVRTAAVRHFLPDAAVTGYDTAVAAALATLPPRRPGVRRVLVGAPDRAGWQNAPGLRGQRERGGGAGAGAGRAGHRHGRGRAGRPLCRKRRFRLCGARPHPPPPGRGQRDRALCGQFAELQPGRVRGRRGPAKKAPCWPTLPPAA